MRYVWIFLGLISLALGLLGIPLPLLPTVPFLLLSAFFFAKGSERLHLWLMTHPKLGPPIADWNERGAIGLRAKWLAMGSIAFVFGLSFLMGMRPMILWIQGVTLCCVLLFIWTRPNK